MWWVWAAQSWLPTTAVVVMTVLAFVAALAQAPRMAKLYWLIDRIVPPEARRAELFNRGGAPAPWIVFGNESGSA